jgi:hypothetical protein
VVSHGCLVVDGTDGGVHMGKAVVLAGQDQAETMPQGILDFDYNAVLETAPLSVLKLPVD